jgi:hypothetical protein
LYRDTTWSIPEDYNIPPKLMEAIRSNYKNTKICIRFMDGMISEPITTNKGVRQGCQLSPLLIKIYTNKVIKELKMNVTGGIQLSNHYILNTTLHTDDQVLTSKSEDELRTLTYHLHSFAKKLKLKSSSSKTKSK